MRKLSQSAAAMAFMLGGMGVVSDDDRRFTPFARSGPFGGGRHQWYDRRLKNTPGSKLARKASKGTLTMCHP